MSQWNEGHLIRLMTEGNCRQLDSHGHPITPETTLPTATQEGTLLTEIRSLARRYGFESYHTHDSRKSEPGFPDLVLTNGHSLLLYELKTNTGKLTTEQDRWLSLLTHASVKECGVWRPRDWALIEARLRKG